MGVTVGVQVLPHGVGLGLPAYATPGSAGVDLMAAIPPHEKITLSPGRWGLVPSGLALHLPENHEGQVRPRSGLAAKHGVTVLNAPGTIDADFRGEVKVLLVNLGHEPFVIERGMRIAQLVIAPVTQVLFQEQDQLPGSARGAGGFGSTGV